jgi:hypothetical protein
MLHHYHFSNFTFISEGPSKVSLHFLILIFCCFYLSISVLPCTTIDNREFTVHENDTERQTETNKMPVKILKNEANTEL